MILLRTSFYFSFVSGFFYSTICEPLPSKVAKKTVSKNWVFGSKRSAMFRNVCKNNFPYFFSFHKIFHFKFLVRDFSTKIFDEKLCFAPILLATEISWNKMISRRLRKLKKFANIFFVDFFLEDFFWDHLKRTVKRNSSQSEQKFFCSDFN